jgi:photosystem II stability/assembly factor-like uncharacterized protein
MTNNRIPALFLFIATTVALPSYAQRIEMLAKGPDASLRGLSAVNDLTVWVSGSKGTVGRTNDGGRTWQWNTVKGFEKTDFRDIEAFDEKTAVIMGVGEPGLILRTEDGGANWHKVFTDSTKGMFLDAMDFLPDGRGIVVGDPVDGRVFMAETDDGGRTWKKLPTRSCPIPAEGEAFFAASGTNIRLLPDGGWIAVTGGQRSKCIGFGKSVPLPLIQGGPSRGANSIAYRASGKRLVAVGGDFSSDTLREGNACLSRDGGKSWSKPRTSPHGYRSSVEWWGGKEWVACGTSGVDLSTDDGKNWSNLGRESFHVCRRAKKGDALYLAGSGGRVARVVKDR